jgi:hypothetical protein
LWLEKAEVKKGVWYNSIIKIDSGLSLHRFGPFHFPDAFVAFPGFKRLGWRTSLWLRTETTKTFLKVLRQPPGCGGARRGNAHVSAAVCSVVNQPRAPLHHFLRALLSVSREGLPGIRFVLIDFRALNF